VTIRIAPLKPILVLCLCLSMLGCSSGSSNGGPPPPPPNCEGVGARDSIRFPIVTEIEPNNDISNAFGVTVPTPTASESVGLLVLGSVHDSLDPIDTIAFTSTRTIKYFIKLCEDSCNGGSGNDKDSNPDSLDTSIAYFDVLDATGMIMGSSSTNISAENYTELCIEGGVISYIQILARNTLNAAQDYKITAMETF
jgi:hypothetical protein